MSSDSLSIETTQNVTIEFQPASVAERILATLIDYFIFFIYYLLIIFLIYFLRFDEFWFIIILVLPYFFYDILMELIFNGQSVGKMLMGIKVARPDGIEPTLGNFIIRWIFRIVDSMICLGSVAVITIIINGKGQRLGDLAAGTNVIKSRKKSKHISNITHIINENYQVQFSQVAMLNDNDINTVREVVALFRNNPSSNSIILLEKTKNKIEEKLNIKSEMHPLTFLETIITDYTYVSIRG